MKNSNKIKKVGYYLDVDLSIQINLKIILSNIKVIHIIICFLIKMQG